jgi:hypothetical protein
MSLKKQLALYMKNHQQDALSYIDAHMHLLPEGKRDAYMKGRESGNITPAAIVGLIIAIYLLATLLPGAVSALNTANQSGWTSTQTTLYAVLAIIVIAGGALVILKIVEG